MSIDRSPTRRSITSTYLANLETTLNQTPKTTLPPPSYSPTRGLLHSRANLFENASPSQVPISPSRSRSQLVPCSSPITIPSSSSRSPERMSVRPRSILDMPSSPTRLKFVTERSQPSSPISRSPKMLALPSLPNSPVKPTRDHKASSSSSSAVTNESLSLANPPVLNPLEPKTAVSIPKSPRISGKLKSPFLDNDVKSPVTPRPLPPVKPTSKFIPKLSPAPPPKFNIPSSPTLRTLSALKQQPQDIPKLKTKPLDTPFEEQLRQEYKSSSSSSSSSSRISKISESHFLSTIINFQAHARGANTRYSYFIHKKMLEIHTDQTIALQSVSRRALLLSKIGKDKKTREVIEPQVKALQAVIRGILKRRELREIEQTGSSCDIIKLESIIRGSKTRETIDRINFELFKHESRILVLQSKIRGNVLHDRVRREIESRAPLTKFQSVARRVLFERKIQNKVSAVHSSKNGVLFLQAIVRGNKTRNDIKEKIVKVQKSEEDLLELQSIIRAGKLRNRLNVVLDTLEYEDQNLNKLCAKIRGGHVRDEVARIKIGLENSTQSIVNVQSQIRGVITRYGYDLLLDTFDFYTPSITSLQSLIRGHLFRKSQHEMLRYYEQFLPKIIKIQSHIRGKYQGTAYKSLLGMSDPPLEVIKRFVHLLSDTDVDFKEEVQLMELKGQISAMTGEIENVEREIEKIRVKVGLLEKNHVGMDEVVREMKTSLVSTSSHLINDIDLSSLNHKSKTKIELFEKLFYLLQTQPSYFTKLLNVSQDGIEVVLKVFNNLRSEDGGLPTREEYLFLKLLEAILRDGFAKSDCSVEKLIRSKDREDWEVLLREFVCDTSLEFHKSALGEILEVLVDNDDVDFESDPVVIYRRLKGTSPYENRISENEAISDPETERQFIENLQQLRGYSTEIFNSLQSSINSIPPFIKILAKMAYSNSLKKNPNYVDQEHLSIAGYIFIQGFVNVILKPTQFQKIFQSSHSNISKLHKNNLLALANLLTRLFTMKPFTSSDPYYQPLNRHILTMNDSVISFMKSLLEIGDIDSVYDRTIYDDLTSHHRPNLQLDIRDILSIGDLIQKDIDNIAPFRNDALREVIMQIRSLSTPDMFRLKGYYTLSLNPAVYKPDGDEMRIKALEMQLKRCMVYLIQVQDDHSTLRGLLEETSSSQGDEFKFRRLIEQEQREMGRFRVNEYVNEGQGSIGNLSRMSYHTLKLLILQRISELQSLNHLSPNQDEAYQSIINAIANDIRSKTAQRHLRHRHIQTAQTALIRLQEKRTTLSNHLQYYATLIDTTMAEIQSSRSPSKKRHLLPFTKQYFYERELKRDGRVPKFGAYKYSYKKLYEKGILLVSDMDPLATSSFFTGLSFPRVDFMFVCNEPGVFEISTKSYDSSKIAMNGFKETLTLDMLLFEYQFEKKDVVELFAGKVRFDTYAFTGFIFRKFYQSN